MSRTRRACRRSWLRNKEDRGAVGFVQQLGFYGVSAWHTSSHNRNESETFLKDLTDKAHVYSECYYALSLLSNTGTRFSTMQRVRISDPIRICACAYVPTILRT
jgi:hypothetical protein